MTGFCQWGTGIGPAQNKNPGVMKNIFEWSHESQKACASAGFWAREATEKLEAFLAAGADPKAAAVIDDALELLFAIEGNSDRAKHLNEKIRRAASKHVGPKVVFKPDLELIKRGK